MQQIGELCDESQIQGVMDQLEATLGSRLALGCLGWHIRFQLEKEEDCWREEKRIRLIEALLAIVRKGGDPSALLWWTSNHQVLNRILLKQPVAPLEMPIDDLLRLLVGSVRADSPRIHHGATADASRSYLTHGGSVSEQQLSELAQLNRYEQP